MPGFFRRDGKPGFVGMAGCCGSLYWGSVGLLNFSFSTTKLFCSHAVCVNVGALSVKMPPGFLPLGRCNIKLSFATVVKQFVLLISGHGSKCCSKIPSGLRRPLEAMQILSISVIL